jgi:hypothetical protein
VDAGVQRANTQFNPIYDVGLYHVHVNDALKAIGDGDFRGGGKHLGEAAVSATTAVLKALPFIDGGTPKVEPPTGNSASSAVSQAADVRAVNENAVTEWARDFERKPTPTSTAAGRYEVAQTGPLNIHLEGGGVKVWADGLDAPTAKVQEAKLVDNPGRSPFVDGSACPSYVRDAIREKVENEFERYAKVINDPSTPVDGLQVIVSHPAAIPYFTTLMERLRIPGTILVKP